MKSITELKEREGSHGSHQMSRSRPRQGCRCSHGRRVTDRCLGSSPQTVVRLSRVRRAPRTTRAGDIRSCSATTSNSCLADWSRASDRLWMDRCPHYCSAISSRSYIRSRHRSPRMRKNVPYHRCGACKPLPRKRRKLANCVQAPCIPGGRMSTAIFLTVRDRRYAARRPWRRAGRTRTWSRSTRTGGPIGRHVCAQLLLRLRGRLPAGVRA